MIRDTEVTFQPKRSAEALEPANQILGAIMARWKYGVENDDHTFADISCLADDLSWGDDIVDDHVHDLVYLGHAAVLPDGTFAPTEKGAQHYAGL